MKFSYSQCAEILGYKEATLRKLACLGELKTTREGKKIYITEKDLNEFANKKGLNIQDKLADFSSEANSNKKYILGYKITGEGVKALQAIQKVIRHEFLYKEQDKALIDKFLNNLDSYLNLFEDENGKPLKELIAKTKD